MQNKQKKKMSKFPWTLSVLVYLFVNANVWVSCFIWLNHNCSIVRSLQRWTQIWNVEFITSCTYLTVVRSGTLKFCDSLSLAVSLVTTCWLNLCIWICFILFFCCDKNVDYQIRIKTKNKNNNQYLESLKACRYGFRRVWLTGTFMCETYGCEYSWKPPSSG